MVAETRFSFTRHWNIYHFSTGTMDGSFTNNGHDTETDHGSHPHVEEVFRKRHSHTPCRSSESERTLILPSTILSRVCQYMARSTVIHTNDVLTSRSTPTCPFFSYRCTTEIIQMGDQLGSQPPSRFHFSQRQKTVQERSYHHQLQGIYLCQVIEICSYRIGSDVETSLASKSRTILYSRNLESSPSIFPQTVYCWGSQCCLKCVRLGWDAVSASLVSSSSCLRSCLPTCLRSGMLCPPP